MNRPAVWALLSLLVAGCTAPDPEGPAPAARRPDVLLVVLDTTRADYLSSYGYPRPTTPRLDELAAAGTRFERAFSTSFWTLPAHASLLTGLYPGQAGATSESHRLPDGPPTVAERLRQAGYRTFGASCNSWISSERGFGRGFERFEEPWRLRPEEEPEPAALRQSVEWIAEAAAGEAPYFLFVNLNSPHQPYDPPRALARRFVSPRWPGTRLGQLSRIAGPWAHLTGRLWLDGDDFAMLRDLYAAEVHYADQQVGQLLAALERAGTLDRTVVIVTSDHGESLGEHGRLGHALGLFDTTLRVPLIVRYPERFTAGSVVGALASLLDVAPTILDLAAAVPESERDAVERRSLARERRGGRRFVVAENDRPIGGVELLREQFPDFDAATIDHPVRAIRTDRYKLIWKVGVGVELYDLADDPGERTDLAASLPAVRDDLLRGLEVWESEVRSGDRPEMFRSQDEEAREWLRSLGYIQ